MHRNYLSRMFLNVKKIVLPSFHEGAFSIRLRRRFGEGGDRYPAWMTLHVVENKIIFGENLFFLFVRSFLLLRFPTLIRILV